MTILENEFVFLEEKEPFKQISLIFSELQKIQDSIKYYEGEIGDLKNNNYHSHFPSHLEIDPIHELLNEPITLEEYIAKLEKLKSKSIGKGKILIQPHIDNGDRIQRSEIIVPLKPPTKKELEERIEELEGFILKSEEKQKLLLKEFDKAKKYVDLLSKS